VLCLKDELGSKIELEYSMTLSTNWGNDFLNAYATQINALEAQAKKTGAPASYDKALEDEFKKIKDQVLGSPNSCGGKSSPSAGGSCGKGASSGAGNSGGAGSGPSSSGSSTGGNVLITTPTPPTNPAVDAGTEAGIDAMNKAYQQAQADQFGITVAKTADDAANDASKQRPSG
jgi:hypothetical protein